MDVTLLCRARTRAPRFVVAVMGAALVIPALTPATAAATLPVLHSKQRIVPDLGVLLPTPIEDPATPSPDDGPTMPASCSSPVPLPAADCVPPVTKITKRPVLVDGKTREKTAAFEFRAYEPDEAGNASASAVSGATFECQLKEPAKPTPTTWEACAPGTSYPTAVDGAYVFSVRARDAASPPNPDGSPETFAWSVDTAAPETTITSGPSAWVLANSATFRLASSEPTGSTFRCSLDGSGRYCSSGGAPVAFAPGTHTITAVAKDAVGNEDLTPASRTFTMPRDDKGLKHSTGWRQGKGSGYFLSTFSSTTRKGATLSASASRIKRVALIATVGRGFGVVQVYLGTKLLKQVSLAANRTAKKKVMPIATFPTATRGTVKVVVASAGKKVVVEGLGIASR